MLGGGCQTNAPPSEPYPRVPSSALGPSAGYFKPNKRHHDTSPPLDWRQAARRAPPMVLSCPRLRASAPRGHRAFGCIRMMIPLLSLPQTAHHAGSQANGLGPTRRTLSSLFRRADIAGWLRPHEAVYVVAPLESRGHPLPADSRLHAGTSAYDQPVLSQLLLSV